MYLCILFVDQWQRKHVPVTQATCNITAKARRNCFVVSFNLPICLWVMGGCRQLSFAKMLARRCEELVSELYIIVC